MTKPYLLCKLFSQGEEVMIWLGEESHNSSMAFDLIRRVVIAVSVEQASNPLNVFKSLDGQDLLDAGPPEHSHPAWKALDSFFWRPWFTQVWLVQEVTVAKSASVLCRPHQCQWSDLTTIAEAGKYTKVKPDYKKNLVDVYTGLTRQFIPEDRNLDVLSAFEDHRFRLERDCKDDQRNSLGGSELPKNKQLLSRVPDWEVHRPSSPFLLHPCFVKWRAAGLSMASCTFSTNHSTFLSYGIAYDTVAYVGDSFLESVPTPGSLFPQSEASNVRFRTKFGQDLGTDWLMEQRGRQWERMARNLRTYHTGEDVLDAIIRTLTARNG